ncbi:MAG: UDP-N-acetylmuramate dehydrogenase [Lachnospiraceae bacterium]|nr:UDP-N-acetylmuramate dehydrogenase [Lachnospiraceae bacterium]
MINRLKALLTDERVLVNERLDRHTTFKVGGPCKALLLAETTEELKAVLRLLKEEGEDSFILGNGSNLLVSDEGYDGYVIKLVGDFLSVKLEGDSIVAEAGVLLSKVCTFARDNALSGLEFAYGIPGTVGGAMVMNAGAYGGEMKDVTESVSLLYNGDIVTRTAEEMQFGYRDSIIKHDDYIALETRFKLKKESTEKISAAMNDYMDRRRSKQPLEFPSAGSTFKRPEGAFAGKLIEDSGLKGFRVGGASVSVKHAGFVVNDQNGTAADIDELMKRVAERVKKDSGFVLEPEVIRIGRF